MSKKAPKAPDPKETAAAQTGTNVSTAIANATLGNVNQITPDGTLSYATTGYETIKDPTTGVSYQVPIRTATTTLSEQQQAIKDQTDAANLNLGTIANEQSAFLKDYLKQPVDLSNEATEARLFELGSARLDPRFAEQEEATRTRLLNSGIREGSAAYDAAMRNFSQGKNDAYNSLLLSGRQQAVSEALAERNQPLNEIGALLSGSQVDQPNWAPAQGTSMPTVDYAGLVNQDYQNRLAAWQQQQSMAGGALGGLFGLGKAAIMASDKRVKKDIQPVGEINGHKVYEYSYKGKFDDGNRHIGVIAQEVERKRPDAVTKGADGIRRVDYGRLFQMGAEKKAA